MNELPMALFKVAVLALLLQQCIAASYGDSKRHDASESHISIDSIKARQSALNGLKVSSTSQEETQRRVPLAVESTTDSSGVIRTQEAASGKNSADQLNKRPTLEGFTGIPNRIGEQGLNQDIEERHINNDEVVLNRLDLARLSKVRMNTKGLSVERRCSIFGDELRKMLGDKGFKNQNDLFNQVVPVLSRRKLPFGNSQPFLIDLQECLQSSVNNAPILPEVEPKREVIASPPHRQPIDSDSQPQVGMKKAIGEFKNVRNNVKDFGQDIYLPDNKNLLPTEDDKANDQLEEQNSELEQVDNGKEVDGKGSFRRPTNIDAEFDHKEDELRNTLERIDETINNKVENLHHIREETNDDGDDSVITVLQGNDDQDHEWVKDNDNDSIKNNDNYFQSNLRQNLKGHQYVDNYQEQSIYDNDGVYRHNKGAFQHEKNGDLVMVLEDNQHEIADLKQELAELKEVADRATDEADQAKAALNEAVANYRMQAPLKESKPADLNTRAQYEAVVKREQNLLNILDEFKAKAEEQERFIREEMQINNDDDDDDDDDYFSHKKQIEDPIIMATKLQTKLDSNENIFKRCYKYYLLFSYPKKVTKYVVKTIAKLRVSGIESFNQELDSDYNDTLSQAADILVQSSRKKVIAIGRDLEYCLEQTQQQVVNPYEDYPVRSSRGARVPIYRPIPPIPPMPPMPPMQRSFRFD